MNLLVMLFVFWTMIYGVAMIVGQHNRWVSFSKKLANRFWGAHKGRILWLVIGVAITLYFLQPRYP
jgi:hypothetical protein